MATVDIIIPSRRGMPHECNAAYGDLLHASMCRCGTHAPWQCDKGKHSVREIPKPVGSSIVHWARNHVITTALYGMDPAQEMPGRPKADFLFLMDDDMLPAPEHLSRLLSWNRSIVTGISTIRRDPPRPNIRYFNTKDNSWWIIDEWDWDSNELFEVDGVGAAFMLVRRSVFERMGKAYLNCHFEREEDKRKYPKLGKDVDQYWNERSASRLARFNEALKVKENWAQANCWWFQFLDNIVPDQHGETGEDIGFCYKAKKLGFKIWADPQVLPGHLGDYAYSIRDHRGYVELRKEAQARGVESANVNQWDGVTGIHGVDSKRDSC